jgi:hypothetical protein
MRRGVLRLISGVMLVAIVASVPVPLGDEPSAEHVVAHWRSMVWEGMIPPELRESAQSRNTRACLQLSEFEWQRRRPTVEEATKRYYDFVRQGGEDAWNRTGFYTPLYYEGPY